MSGVPVEPVYGPDDGEFPGEYPYTRGSVRVDVPVEALDDAHVRGLRHRARHQPALPRAARRRASDGLSTAFDLPTLMGRDSDDELALGEVGKCGVAVDTLADVEDLYRGIDLGAVTTSMTINGPAAVIFAMYVANAEATGVERARLGGTLQNDILKEYQAQKEFIFPPRPSLRLVADTIRFCSAEMPRFASAFDLRLPHPRSGLDRRRRARVHGCERLRLRGARIAGRASPSTRSRRACRSSSTRTSTSSRRSPSTAPHAGSGPAGSATATARKSERSLQMRFHTQTAGVSLTAQQPEVNIVRTAIEALAGVLGGTQSLHTNSMDETFALPTETRGAHRAAHAAGDRERDAGRQRRRSARRLVVRRSAHRRARAPGGGGVRACRASSATGSMLDGAVRGVEEGWFQSEIADSAYELERKLNAGRHVIVGVTAVPRGERRAAARDAAHRARGRGGAAAPAREGAPRPRRERRGANAGTGAGRRRRADHQPDARAARCGARVRDAGRDRRRARRACSGVGSNSLGSDRIAVRHARDEDLDRIEPLLAQLRSLDGLTEKSRGVFYRRSRACLHFHADGDDTYADVRFTGDEFERTRTTTKAEQQALVAAARRRARLASDAHGSQTARSRARGQGLHAR